MSPIRDEWRTDDGSVRLLLGDCLEILPTLESGSVDAVVADPPYSSGGLFKAARCKAVNDKYVQSGAKQYAEFSGDAKDQRSWVSWLAHMFRLCQRVAKDNRYLLSFVDWRQLPAMTDAVQWADWTWCGVIPWNKGLGSRAGNTSMFRHQCEYVVWCTKGGTAGYSDRSGPWPGFFECNAVPALSRDHQSQKPVALIESLLACCNCGDHVLDPFAGSGSTGVAAVRNGLRFTGCELDAGNFGVAKKRIRDELDKTRMIEKTPTLRQTTFLEPVEAIQ